MKQKSFRTERVAEQIQRDLADILQFEVHDPRVKKVTFLQVEVTRDFSEAKIYFSVPQPEDIEEASEGLKNSAGFFRSQLSRRLNIRHTPALHFIFDESLQRGERLSRLIDEAIQQDQP